LLLRRSTRLETCDESRGKVRSAQAERTLLVDTHLLTSFEQSLYVLMAPIALAAAVWTSSFGDFMLSSIIRLHASRSAAPSTEEGQAVAAIKLQAASRILSLPNAVKFVGRMRRRAVTI
jgi:hypothetical protein